MVWAFHVSRCSSRDGRDDSWAVSCSVLWGSCFCPPSVTGEDGGHQLLRSFLFQVLQRLVLALLVFDYMRKDEACCHKHFPIYAYRGPKCSALSKFPKLILAGRRHISESLLSLLPAQSLKYIEVHFCSTYLNQLPQLQVLLNICMISKARFFLKLVSCRQTEMQMAKQRLTHSFPT